MSGFSAKQYPYNGAALTTGTNVAMNSATATAIVALNGTRKTVAITNLSSTPGETVYIGSTSVNNTTALGIPLLPGATVFLDVGGAVSGISATGAPSVAVLEIRS